MKSLEEIRKFSLNKYKEFLVSHFTGKEFFPLKFSQFGKYKPSEIAKKFSTINDDILELKKNSKEKLGFGYEIEWEMNNHRNSGKNQFPKSIYFSNQIDYLKFIAKEKEFSILQEDSKRLFEVFPELQSWILQNPMRLVSISDDLEDIISVCNFLKENPKPNLYVRELPIAGIDTKFIEKNSSILKQFLDRILDASNILSSEDNFEKRYFLKTKSNLVRFRILSKQGFSMFPGSIRDISLPFEEFLSLDFFGVKVFITENLTNFLSFPAMENAIIIYGEGYSVINLKALNNLQDLEIYYWGDIDLRGFDILSKFREYFPNTKSFLMDAFTYETFSHLSVNVETEATPSGLKNLTIEESELFDFLKKVQNGNRLEQERIPFDYIQNKLEKI